MRRFRRFECRLSSGWRPIPKAAAGRAKRSSKKLDLCGFVARPRFFFSQCRKRLNRYCSRFFRRNSKISARVGARKCVTSGGATIVDIYTADWMAGVANRCWEIGKIEEHVTGIRVTVGSRSAMARSRSVLPPPEEGPRMATHSPADIENEVGLRKFVRRSRIDRSDVPV
jgi:hypothetical protein